jgi:hypothetical protein
VLKSINIKVISILLALFSVIGFSYGQNDFAVSWNAYMSGDIVEEDPFNGSFTVSNMGGSIANAGDTLWYGYFIDEVMYDLAFTPGTVSGEVLDEDFEPGGEITIINNFIWPLFGSEITIEFCAVVYGIGYESYTGALFTGDDVDSNNRDCLFAVLPEYVIGINETEESADLSMKFSNQTVFIQNGTESLEELALLEIYNIAGKLVHTEEVIITKDISQVILPALTNGTYVGRLNTTFAQINEKFVISQ